MGFEPKVLIVLGSDSDLPVMAATCSTLEEFGVDYSLRILSAHRVPQEVAALASSAKEQHYQVIIAAAGMAAHLPGVIAAYTTLPVIGVPLQSKVLDGQDALYSIVQMPPGVPVATVGIGAAKNAALLALQILATSDEELSNALKLHKQTMAEAVLAKDSRLQALGYKAYLAERSNVK
ncbi:MAG TPA: 5-(carboxyamino)imidazole ribonucleotide mutase [Firmicutes bacterium]|nr:5-(carboxyamino)imidazole ribonucleotide mutase [Bacillota bacterium]